MSKLMKRNIIDIGTVLAVFLISLGLYALAFWAYTPAFTAAYENALLASRQALAGGAKLELLTDVELVEGVSEVYRSEDGTLVSAVTVRGFESDITLGVAVAADGTVADVAAFSHNETPDKGGMALGSDYLGSYVGVTAADGVDAYTGATYTSEAIKEGINRAIGQYKVVNGLEYDAPVTLSEQELIAQALSATIGERYELLDTELVDSVTAVYASDTGYACVVEGMGFDNDVTDDVGPSPIILLVSFDRDALVTEISTIAQQETAGYGANAFNEYYLNLYDGYGDFVFKYAIPGIDAHLIDSQSNATGTSQSVYYLVKAATEQMKLLTAQG